MLKDFKLVIVCSSQKPLNILNFSKKDIEDFVDEFMRRIKDDTDNIIGKCNKDIPLDEDDIMDCDIFVNWYFSEILLAPWDCIGFVNSCLNHYYLSEKGKIIYAHDKCNIAVAVHTLNGKIRFKMYLKSDIAKLKDDGGGD